MAAHGGSAVSTMNPYGTGAYEVRIIYIGTSGALKVDQGKGTTNDTNADRSNCAISLLVIKGSLGAAGDKC
jgi:hypothetical protein